MASKKNKEEEQQDRLLSLAMDGIKCGFAMAVRMYQPLKDELRMRELTSWCTLNGVPRAAVDALIERKTVEVKAMGSGKNSPKYISLEQLTSALLAEHVRVAMM